MAAVLDRKGHGTETVGWAAWKARWNRCLAELLVAAEVGVFRVAPVVVGEVQEPPALWAAPEKGINVSERVGPGELLQHAGFYYLRAAEWGEERARRAIGAVGEGWDAYLCGSPEEEAAAGHGEQVAMLAAARREFEGRGQRRMVDGVGVRIARLLRQAGKWGEALKELRSVAGGYRREGWWEILEEVLWGVVECGWKSGDGGGVVVAGLELLCKDVFRERRDWRYDLGRCLDGMDTLKVRPTMVVRGGDVVSFCKSHH